MATDEEIARWIRHGTITPAIASALRKERRVRRLWSAACLVIALVLGVAVTVASLLLGIEAFVVGAIGGYLAYHWWRSLERRVHRWRLRDSDVSFSVKIYTDGLRQRDVQ